MNQCIEKELTKNETDLKSKRENEIKEIETSLEIAELYSKALKKKSKIIGIGILSIIETLISISCSIVFFKYGIESQHIFYGFISTVLAAAGTFVTIVDINILPHFTEGIKMLEEKGAREFIKQKKNYMRRKLELEKENDIIKNKVSVTGKEFKNINACGKRTDIPFYQTEEQMKLENKQYIDNLLRHI